MRKTQKHKTYDQGILAERAAELFLRAKGYSILARRYKTKVGEIDIVAKDCDSVVFIEVKARASLDDALSCITVAMKHRIQNAAMMFIADHPEYNDVPMRFDVLALRLPFTIRHIENAFME